MSLYQDFRPTTFDQVVGQDQITAILKSKLGSKDLPHVVLFSGPTGVGKTTLARITAEQLGCTEHNLTKINCADVRGIDSVREIRSVMNLAPMGGTSRVWILDEVVQLPKTTQQAFLEILEDTPTHVWFLLCTSDTTGLLPTFLGRCFILALNALTKRNMENILRPVMEKAGKVDGIVQTAIIANADGSARKALQLLEAALTAIDVGAQLEAIGAAVITEESKGEFIGRLLFNGANWSKLTTAIKDVEDRDLETIRRQVLGYACAMLLNSPKKNLAYLVIRAFEEPWYVMGKAGLAAACWDISQNKS